MMIKRVAFLILGLVFVGCNRPGSSRAPEEGAYTPDWKSLAKHESSPEWFRNAKLGIYFHWGVYSVPAYSSEWYPRNMHIPGHDVYRHHQEFLKIKYTWKDIRYTVNGSDIYATLLGWPGAGAEVNLKAFAADSLPGNVHISEVHLLGSQKGLEWTLEESGLHLVMPDEAPDSLAVVIKIEAG